VRKSDERGGSGTGVVAAPVIFLIAVTVAVFFVSGSRFGAKNVQVSVHTTPTPAGK
jgi:uncharacterized membrane-anchored protein